MKKTVIEILMPSTKVIVSGATGFVGRHVVKKLADHKYEVIALVRNLDKAASIKELSNATHCFFDITNPSLIPTLPTDAIFIHCAWDNVRDTQSLIHIEEHLINNYFFLKNLISHGIKKLVVTGSCYEYGLQYGPIKSSAATQPNTPYAIAKDSLHKSLRALQAELNFELIWARLFYMYGEGQDRQSIISEFDNALENNLEEFNMSLGDQLLDYLPVKEVASKIIDLLPNNSGVFNICSGEPISLRRLLENRAKDRGKKIHLNLGFYPYRNQDAMAIWGDPSD